MTADRPFYTALIAVLKARSTAIVITRTFVLFQLFIALIIGAAPTLGQLLITFVLFILFGCPFLASRNTLLGVPPPTPAAAWCSTRVVLGRLGYAAKIGLSTVVLSLILVFYLDYQHAVGLFKTLTNQEFKNHVHVAFALGAVLGLVLSRWRINTLKPAPSKTSPMLEKPTE